MESLMDNIQVQPWLQYEDDVTKYNVKDIEMGMNKEINQMVSKQSFTEVDASVLTPEQLSKVVGTRWVITGRPSSNGGRDIKCRFCGKDFSQSIDDKDVQTFAAMPSSMAMSLRLLLTISTVKGYAVYTTDVASAFLNTPIDEEVYVQTPREYYHNRPTTLRAMKKALYGLRTSPKQWQEHLSTILKEMGFNRLKSDACIFGNVKTN
eukprot:582125-Amphidinium_carterae.4